MYKFKIFNFFSDELKISWHRLESSSSLYIFQTFNWNKHWYETIGIDHNCKINIVEVSNEMGQVLLIIPLVKRRKHIFYYCEFFGGIQFDYHAPIINESFVWTEIEFHKMWRGVIDLLINQNICYLHLKNQPEFINILSNPFYKYLNNYSVEKSNYIDFSLEENYFKRKNLKRILADSQRQKKRLSLFGDVKFIISNNSLDFANQIEMMISQKENQYLSNNINNYLKKESVKNFYRFSFNNENNIHMTSLQINGKILSTHWGAVYEGRFYYLMPTYDRGEMSKYSTGKLLLEELIKWSLNNGVKIFDFTIGGELYKKEWCNSEMAISNSLIPLTNIGKFYCFYELAKFKIINLILKWDHVMFVYRHIRGYLKKKNV